MVISTGHNGEQPPNGRHERGKRRAERHSDRLGECHASRRRLKPEARRTELIEAALTVLRGREPGEVRIEDVTRAAGAAKGTFYLYFSSWNELMTAVRDHVLNAYIERLLDRFASVGTAAEWWTALDEECSRFVDFHLELGTVHKAIFHGDDPDSSLQADHSDQRLIARLIRQGVALRACRPVDEDTAAPLVFALLHSTADSVSRGGERESRLEVLITLLHRWLATPAD